jgi:EAL domain-containing protein (putative c-di-GMP-specific phosphodiesterase class I)
MAQACRDRQGWRSDGRHDSIGVSINVSADQLMARDFVQSVSRVLSETNTEPRHVMIETTESSLGADRSRALRVFTALKSLGVMLALDHFGTGQSSLIHLKQFPFDVVKIDREFVSDVGTNRASRLIVRALTGLAHDLGMTVTAEGVENVGQLDAVATLDCDFSQGFYLSAPVSSEDLGGLMAMDLTFPRNRPFLRASTGKRAVIDFGDNGGPLVDAVPLSVWRRNT